MTTAETGPALLTIGQVADYVGLTVRAIRHYHQRGLIPEPERDVSGYRRYDAGAVIELIRIKALADAGVPLARIEEVLGAGPEEFAGALSQIDKALTQRIKELQEQRRRISHLAGGDRLYLPAEIADLFDKFRELGISPRAIQIERDGWILLAARYPDQARQWAREKLDALTSPDFQQIYQAYNAAYDYAADDPRLDAIADSLLDFAEQHQEELQRHATELGQVSAGSPLEDSVAMALVLSRTADLPASWIRLDELCQEKAAVRGLTMPPTTQPA
jgi:DNA-binding transcriptional MerR regulator